MKWYLDSSVAIHAVLPAGDPRARAWLTASSEQAVDLCSSRLLQLEMVRTLRREQMDPAWARLVTDRIELIGIDDGVLRFAAAIEPHLKSLDAIHLATCSLLGDNFTVVTHDARMAEVAIHMGFNVHDPLIAKV
ncbi:MAG TPA: type II toxin-antitoxin system VapC family toxin [Oleiagrimonas sp.]|nr:type II toxin-antitoxin system VapC family toxin [Oleiagrimonas sp.]